MPWIVNKPARIRVYDSAGACKAETRTVYDNNTAGTSGRPPKAWYGLSNKRSQLVRAMVGYPMAITLGTPPILNTMAMATRPAPRRLATAVASDLAGHKLTLTTKITLAGPSCCQVMSIVFALFLSTGYNVRYVF